MHTGFVQRGLPRSSPKNAAAPLYNPDTIPLVVCGVLEQLAIKSHWGSCASACFESSMDNCVPNSFVVLEKKILTADGGCNSDGMAWRRYHTPINDEWIALGNAYGNDLRQFGVITFAMPPFISSKFSTPASIFALPVVKGILIKTTIEGGYHKDDAITLRQHPELIYKLHHKINGSPYAAFVDDTTVPINARSHAPSHPSAEKLALARARRALRARRQHHRPGLARRSRRTAVGLCCLSALSCCLQSPPSHVRFASRARLSHARWPAVRRSVSLRVPCPSLHTKPKS